MAPAAAPATAASSFESSRALGIGGGGRGGRSGGAGGMGGYSGGSISASDAGKERLVQYAQQTQFVAGKNFFQNNKQWIDSEVQKYPNAKHVRIQFGSPEYFDLLAKNPKALPWVALGQDLQFVLDNTVYEIFGIE
jgi:hypothetical protein